MKFTIPALALLALATSSIAQAAEEVRLYTQRHYEADLKVFEKFTAETGIEVKLVKAGADELIARMESEKDRPQADLFVTVDAATLDRADKAGLLEPHGDEELAQRFAKGFAPESGAWVPFTMRARVMVYNPKTLSTPPKNYADLADPDLRGRVLIRSSSSHYNQSLLASIIAAEGEGAATQWAQGVKQNMARPPQGGDRDQVRAVAQGLGDVAVSNSYYLGLLEKSDDPKDRAARAAVKIVFPNQSNRGTHVNISGGGLVKGGPNREHALKLMKFITSEEIQTLYPELTSEFAVVEGVEPTAMQKRWGDFKPDFTTLHQLSDNSEQAVTLFNLVGWQ